MNHSSVEIQIIKIFAYHQNLSAEIDKTGVKWFGKNDHFKKALFATKKIIAKKIFYVQL